MKSIGLIVSRGDLLQALVTLGVTRRRRFRSVVPVWLHHDAERRQLAIVEERGAVTAHVRAEGDWPPAGATIDLYALKRAVERHPDDPVEFIVAADSILLAGDGWHARLNLRKFGPESTVHDPLDGTPTDSADRGHPLADLPLFRWAAGKS
jgi:hypothetical protein